MRKKPDSPAALSFNTEQQVALWRDALDRAGYAGARRTRGFHCSQLLNPRGDRAAAERAYRQLLTVLPDHREGLEGLAYLLQLQGRQSEARVYRRRLLQLRMEDLAMAPEAQDEAADYLLAAETGDSPPDQAPPAYVKGLFDHYAANFDDHLVSQLNYRGPELLLDMLRPRLADATQPLEVLDIGCGTGLAGVIFKPLSSRLDGIDLSPKMLNLARERGVYDHLEQGDIIRRLGEHRCRYHLVVAADVLNYFGDLLPVFKAVKAVLYKDGYFVFSVERGEGSVVRLRSTGRYQHTAEYVRQCAQLVGLEVLCLEQARLRVQDGQPVIGFLIALQMTA